MKIYLDDDSAWAVLVRLLNKEGHDVVIPADAGLAGEKDPEHFMFAIGNGRALLTHNHDDFELLHELVLLAGGHHREYWWCGGTMILIIAMEVSQ
jgi:predicted nuclease of predicted toxin-antitoxin system